MIEIADPADFLYAHRRQTTRVANEHQALWTIDRVFLIRCDNTFNELNIVGC